MKASPKWLLVLALSGLVGGVLVASSHRNLPLALEVLMPLGAIFTGLFLVSLLLKKEAVKFNEDERSKIEAIRLYQSSDWPKTPSEDTSGIPRVPKAAERTPQDHDDGAAKQARMHGATKESRTDV